MRIGIDLDGVVFDTEKAFRVESEIYETLTLKQNTIKDNRALTCQKRYAWSEETVQDFLKLYHEKIVLETNYMVGAKEVLNLLKKDGHTLIVITARGGLNKKIMDLTKERMKKDKTIDLFDKIYFQTERKDEVCIKENIDLMIDDYIEKCKMVSEKNIKTIYFKAAESYEAEENENLKVLYNWGEIYRYIKELSK